MGQATFLVIAYKEMRAIEAEINERRDEADRRTEIPLTNYRGIELRDFPAEIARLALIIAEYQCDVTYRGQKEALAEFLPLDAMNWITCGNALRLDWLSICPPTGTGVKHHADDLFMSPVDQAEIDFENEGGETYICGNPPYVGDKKQTSEQRDDMKLLFSGRCSQWKSLDYVAGWFMKAADYAQHTDSASAFVTTNSICQGQQVALLWPLVFSARRAIHFAHTSFKWANLAAHNAGVTVSIVGLASSSVSSRQIFSVGDDGFTTTKKCENINPYLIGGSNIFVRKLTKSLSGLPRMTLGNVPYDGGNLLLNSQQKKNMLENSAEHGRYIKKFYGSAEFIRGISRYCLWVPDHTIEAAMALPEIAARVERVREMRLASSDAGTRALGARPHQMREMNVGKRHTIVVPRVSSENRPYLPVGLVNNDAVIGDKNYAMYDAPYWSIALIGSTLHRVWIGTVCVRLRTDFSYGSTLGWNTFPVPKLTEKNKQDLTRCAEDILLAREAHFPATIADLYDPEKMPADLRAAHDRNRRNLGAHLHRPPVPQRHRTPRKALRTLYQDDHEEGGMSEFNRMTVAASAEVIEGMKTQAAFTSLALQWGVENRCGTGSVHSKVNAMAHVAINEESDSPYAERASVAGTRDD